MSIENEYYIPSYKLSMNDNETLSHLKSYLKDAISNEHDIVYFYEDEAIYHHHIFENINLIVDHRIHFISNRVITSGPLLPISNNIYFTYRLEKVKSFYLTSPIFKLLLLSIEENRFNNIIELLSGSILRKFVIGSKQPQLSEQEIIIIVPFRNCINFIDACYESLTKQNYSNYRILLIDDCSTDGTSTYIEKFRNERITIIRNPKQLFAIESIVSVLANLAPESKSSIITIVDGDDILLHNFVLQTINWYYSFYRCKLTYGSYISLSNGQLHSSSYSKDDFNNIRNARWNASHLKTFQYDLFHTLQRTPNFDMNFKNDKGYFLKAPYDMALMFPLLELAGHIHSKHIEYPLYGYRIHSNNDHIMNRKEQEDGERILREKRI
ncbi:glycosyltransferase family A protein [Sphingobacterium ginsenosidimutans]|uniref:Glycosyltransferase 2-like domain-containing protein n=2 Tax=Sphingobacterium TaxID=28453 RepID=A0ABP8AET7_9SPHI